MKKIITFIILFFLTSGILYAEEKMTSMNTSSYTSIEEKDCIALDSDDMGSIEECESFSGIGVKVIEGDIRQSIILTRNKKEYALDFSSMLSSAFFSLGLTIEWRHELTKPKSIKGLIVQVEVSDDYENLDKVSSYLLVSKITKDTICIVAKISPQKEQKEIAREILDTREDLACLKELIKDEKK